MQLVTRHWTHPIANQFCSHLLYMDDLCLCGDVLLVVYNYVVSSTAQPCIHIALFGITYSFLLLILVTSCRLGSEMGTSQCTVVLGLDVVE